MPRDYAEAVKWYRKAAEQGDPRHNAILALATNWTRRAAGLCRRRAMVLRAAKQSDGLAQGNVAFATQREKARHRIASKPPSGTARLRSKATRRPNTISVGITTTAPASPWNFAEAVKWYARRGLRSSSSPTQPWPLLLPRAAALRRITPSCEMAPPSGGTRGRVGARHSCFVLQEWAGCPARLRRGGEGGITKRRNKGTR